MTYSTLHVLVFCFGPLSLSLSLFFSHSLLVDVLPHRVLVFVLYILPPVHYCSHPSLLLLSGEQLLQGGVFVIHDDVMQTDPISVLCFLFPSTILPPHAAHYFMRPYFNLILLIPPNQNKVIYMLLIRFVHNLAVFFQSR